MVEHALMASTTTLVIVLKDTLEATANITLTSVNPNRVGMGPHVWIMLEHSHATVLLVTPEYNVK